MIVIASYIALPYGYAYWNDNLGVGGLITFAEPSTEASPHLNADKTKCSTEGLLDENPSAVSSEQPVSGQDVSPSAPSNSEATQAGNSGEVSGTVSGAVSTLVQQNNQTSDAPEAILPVKEGDNPTA